MYRTVTVYLNINQDDLLLYYEGAVSEVITRDSNGLKIQFPISILRPFVLHGGVRGRFEICFDSANKFIDIKRVS